MRNGGWVAASNRLCGTAIKLTLAAAVTTVLTQTALAAGSEPGGSRAEGNAALRLGQNGAARTVAFNIESQPMAEALTRLGEQSGLTIIVETKVSKGIRANALSGRYTPDEALKRLLEPAGLKAEYLDSKTVVVRQASESSAHTSGANAESVASSGETAQPGDSVEEVIVTGTHIRGVGPVGSQLIVLDRTDIESTGYATTSQLIQSLPQVSGLGANEASFSRSTVQNANMNGTGGTGANLRGLGPLSTLVLVNGRRVAPSGSGTFVDVGIIPLSAVERVEVMTDGASALYGSDAIGGVVNFVLRKRFEGAETNLRYGMADGFDQSQFSQLLGKAWDSGSALIAYEFEERGELAARKRDYFTQDLRRFGGNDFRDSFSNPGTIMAGPMTYAIPRGQDGRGLAPGDLIAGSENLQDDNLGTTILPDRKQHSVVMALRQDISPRFSLFADGYYARREVEQSIAAVSSLLMVPSTNAFFVSPMPGMDPVAVGYSFLNDLGPTAYRNEVQNYTGTLGGEFKFGGGWAGRLYASHSGDDQTTRLDDIVNGARLALALADSNPATAFNPFGDGSHTNPATLAAIRGYNYGGTKYTVDSVAATADGALFTLPAGEVRLALGGEHRKERMTSDSSSYQSSLEPMTFTSAADRKVDVAYAELFIPIFGEANRRPGLHTLQLSVAGRYERYSDFGSTTNPKVGFTWAPVGDLSVRGSWGTSFQAPALRQLTASSAGYALIPLIDPRSPTGQTLTLLYSAPGNPDLKPQTATTWSFGAEFHPQALPGLRAAVNYFSIDYQKLIGSIGFDIINALRLENIYAPLITRNPDAAFVQAIYDSGQFFGPTVPPALVGAFVNTAPTNLGMLEQRGIDLSLGYEFSTSVGRFGFQSSLTWLLAYDVAQTAVAPLIERLDTLNNPVDLRIRGGATWSRNALNAALFVNYVDGYKNNGVTPVQRVGSWTSVDLQMSYAWRHGLTFALQAQNLFDRQPPFVNNANYGYDPTMASPIGRYVSVSLRKTW